MVGWGDGNVVGGGDRYGCVDSGEGNSTVEDGVVDMVTVMVVTRLDLEVKILFVVKFGL